ncbi:MAG: hypothetical protein IPI61_12230 [Syntrophaceae bacterium]|nr:hypothetical protein [Syntrophaceae bacterium]
MRPVVPSSPKRTVSPSPRLTIPDAGTVAAALQVAPPSSDTSQVAAPSAPPEAIRTV